MGTRGRRRVVGKARGAQSQDQIPGCDMGLCPVVELKAGCRQQKGRYTCTQEGGDWMAQGAFGLSCGW